MVEKLKLRHYFTGECSRDTYLVSPGGACGMAHAAVTELDQRQSRDDATLFIVFALTMWLC